MKVELRKFRASHGGLWVLLVEVAVEFLEVPDEL